MTRLSSTRSLLSASLAIALGAFLGGCAGTGDEDGGETSEQVSQAMSPERECEQAGGTYVHDGPNSTCTMPGEQVGNSHNTKGGSETTGPGKSEPNSETETCTGVNNKPHPCP